MHVHYDQDRLQLLCAPKSRFTSLNVRFFRSSLPRPLAPPTAPVRYSESRGSWGVAKVPTVVVEVEQEDGLIGVGVSTGGEAACFIIEEHLAMFVEGQNVRNISYMWEQMWRTYHCPCNPFSGTLRLARCGLYEYSYTAGTAGFGLYEYSYTAGLFWVV